MNITPVLKREQVKALVIDDAPLVYSKFSLSTKILVGNYIKGSIYINKDELKKYNNILSIDSNYIPSVLLGSEYYVDMREMDAKLKEIKVEHELVDPLAEREKEMQHCCVANERADEISKDAFNRMIKFIKEKTN